MRGDEHGRRYLAIIALAVSGVGCSRGCGAPPAATDGGVAFSTLSARAKADASGDASTAALLEAGAALVTPRGRVFFGRSTSQHTEAVATQELFVARDGAGVRLILDNDDL